MSWYGIHVHTNNKLRRSQSAAEDDLVPEMFVLFLKSAIIIIRNNLFFLFVNFPNHPFTRVLHVVNCSIAIPRS